MIRRALASLRRQLAPWELVAYAIALGVTALVVAGYSVIIVWFSAR